MSKKDTYLIVASILLSGLLIAGAMIYRTGLKTTNQITNQIQPAGKQNNFEEKVIPSNGVELPVKWGNLGKQLVESGVIDAQKFETIYVRRGGLSDEDKKLLSGTENGNLIITSENSGVLLNLFWALGLGNKNEILENGPMTNPKYGGADRFASTGGWTLSQGETMAHYSQHRFIVLTSEQQALVERVSKNIYRPCCDNPTYFPDCNHGMAMLGFLELAASQGANESQLYGMALVLNSYWFSDAYLTIAKYFENKGVGWDKINAKEVLGFDFSSASGYQKILTQVAPPKQRSGGSCGV